MLEMGKNEAVIDKICDHCQHLGDHDQSQYHHVVLGMDPNLERC